jgi:glyoxylase-like metal-dependent hydrolase (beta-lactamase superfamily II)
MGDQERGTMSEHTLTVGNVLIRTLTDAAGLFPPPIGQLTPGVPADHWEPYRDRFPETFADADHFNIHFGSYLVRAGGRTLLVDTGIGPDPAPAYFGGMRGRLPDALAAAGVAPEDVDVVFLTHAHLDHVGWNLTTGGAPTFPRARYLMHRADWEALPALQAALPPYIEQTLLPLQNLGVLELLTGETALAEEVVALPTPGHTPGHMSLLIASGGEQALILGDALVHPAHVTEPDWVFAFDADPETAIATRRALLDRLEAAGMTLLQCHFPAPGAGRIVRIEGRRVFQAL